MSQRNKEMVVKAITELFVERDMGAIDRYWAKNYIQHSPHVADGNASLGPMVASLPEDFQWEKGLVLAEGDYVMVHQRYIGLPEPWGPEPVVVVDMMRIEDGKIAEHWDVLQAEVPASETLSGRSMFSGD